MGVERIADIPPLPPASPISTSPTLGTPFESRFNFACSVPPDDEKPPAPPMATPSTTGRSATTHRSDRMGGKTSGVDSRDVLLCDLGGKSLLVEDLENALRLWSRPAVLIAARNLLDTLPLNVPGTILVLDLSYNRLTSLEGFAALHSLRELDVSHNGVQSMVGLVSNISLRVLRIAHNDIRRVEGLEKLNLLEEADLSYNLVRTQRDVRALSLNSGLRRLYIDGNPICSDGIPSSQSFEVFIKHLMPGVSLLRPMSADAASHTEGSSQNNVRRHGLQFRGSRDDISVQRRWQGLSSANGQGDGETLSLMNADIGQRRLRSRSVERGVGNKRMATVIRATTGGGGPPIGPGSYVERHLATKRREEAVAVIASSDAAVTACTQHVPQRSNAANDSSWNRRGTQSARTGTETRHVQSPTLFDTHRRKKVAAEHTVCSVGDRDVDRTTRKGLRGNGGSIGTADGASASLNPRNPSRAVWAAARRLAWSQARSDGLVGVVEPPKQRRQVKPRDVTMKIKPGQAVSGSNGEGRQAAGLKSSARTLNASRLPAGKKRVVSTNASGASCSPANRFISGGTRSSRGAEASGSIHERARPQKNHSRFGWEMTAVPSNSDTVGQSGSGITSRSRTLQSSRNQGRRQAGTRKRRAGKEFTQTAGSGGRWNNSRGAGVGTYPAQSGVRRPSGGKRSHVGVVSLAGGSNIRSCEKKKVTLTSSSREDYAYTISLGQRSRISTVRPAALQASPWTPREDATPRQGARTAGFRGQGRDRGYDEVMENAECSLFDNPAHSTPRRDENGGSTGGTKHRIYHITRHPEQITSTLNGGRGIKNDVTCSEGGTSSGGGDRPSAVNDWQQNPRFVSPLSPAGICQRAEAARTESGTFKPVPICLEAKEISIFPYVNTWASPIDSISGAATLVHTRGFRAGDHKRSAAGTTPEGHRQATTGQDQSRGDHCQIHGGCALGAPFYKRAIDGGKRHATLWDEDSSNKMIASHGMPRPASGRRKTDDQTPMESFSHPAVRRDFSDLLNYKRDITDGKQISDGTENSSKGFSQARIAQDPMGRGSQKIHSIRGTTSGEDTRGGTRKATLVSGGMQLSESPDAWSHRSVRPRERQQDDDVARGRVYYQSDEGQDNERVILGLRKVTGAYPILENGIDSVMHQKAHVFAKDGSEVRPPVAIRQGRRHEGKSKAVTGSVPKHKDDIDRADGESGQAGLGSDKEVIDMLASMVGGLHSSTSRQT